MVANAGSGHPGIPIGCPELLAYLLGELTEQKLEVSVISLPCIELFDQKPTKYKQSILQHDAKISVSIEPGSHQHFNFRCHSN